MESPTNLLSKIADNRHYAPLLWCIMLLLPIGVLIWGENGNDELSLNDRILSFDAKWKMQTALYVIHLTAVGLSCALLLRLNNTYNLMQQRTWLPATLLLFSTVAYRHSPTRSTSAYYSLPYSSCCCTCFTGHTSRKDSKQPTA